MKAIKMFGILAAVVMVFLAPFSACGKWEYEETEDYFLEYGGDSYPKEYYTKKIKWMEISGIFGEHQLERFKLGETATGQISGTFFLGIGGISGATKSEDLLKFAWQIKPGRIIISSLPVAYIVSVIEENRQHPVIRFKFDFNELNWVINSEYMHQKYPNPNRLIKAKNMIVATVYINSRDLQNEIYLPYFKK